MPILYNIGTLVSCHSTNMFLQYVEEFKRIENRVRRGRTVEMGEQSTETGSRADFAIPQPSSITTQASVTTAHAALLTPSSGSTLSAPSSSTSSAQPDQPGVNDVSRALAVLAANPNAEPATKFQLKFKTALKTKSKGRPLNEQNTSVMLTLIFG